MTLKSVSNQVLGKQRNHRAIQNSWVVNDINAAMMHRVETAGIGPFFVVKGITIDDQNYRGQPVEAPLEVTFALAQAGDIQIELVAQHNDVKSAYRDLVPAGRSGFHHVALYSTDYDADVADYRKTGCDIAFSGAFAGKRFCYVDTSIALGCMIELIEASPAQEEFFTRIATAGNSWDGRDPIRAAF